MEELIEKKKESKEKHTGSPCLVSCSGFSSSEARLCHVTLPHVGGQDQSCEAVCDFALSFRRQKLKLKPMKKPMCS
jgi:hypothetical protein